jgi:hypothetical protein
MHFCFRALVGLVLLACASFAQAQQVNISGTARGLPFASNCTASSGVSYSYAGGNVTVSFACNGITYSCLAQPLPEDQTQVVAFTLGNPGRLRLNCGGATTIVGLQTYIDDYYAIDGTHTSALQWFIDTPPPAGENVPDRMCLALQGRSISAIAFDAASHVLSYTCTGSTGSVASSCYMTSSFNYDANGSTLIVPHCIDAASPTDSPFIFDHGYEGNDAA